MVNVTTQFRQRTKTWGIDDLYNAHYNEHSDFFAHMPYCRDISRGKHVVEFGFRWGQSTAGFLASEGSVHSYDIEPCDEGREVFDEVVKVSNLNWEFTLCDSLLATPENCDILFIDTLHTGAQIYQELMMHHNIVNDGGLIVMHDTETFPDMKFGIRQFQEDAGVWTVKHHFRWCHGLTVLERSSKR